MKQTILETLLTDRPKLNERYKSPQYQLSKEILGYKHENGFTVEEMARILEMSLEEYLEYEGGYTEHSVEEYLNCVEKLKVFRRLSK